MDNQELRPIPISNEHKSPEVMSDSEKRELDLARTHGAFYTKLIEMVLDESSMDVVPVKADNLLSSLPPHLQRLYRSGEGKLVSKLDFQKNWVDENKAEAVDKLTEMVMPSNPGSDEQKAIVIEKTRETGELWEPFPGIPVVVIPAETYDEWKRLGGVFGSGSAVAFLGDQKEEISFLLLREKRMIQELSNTQVMHESHHLIWHFLSRSGFLRRPNTGDESKSLF